MPRRRPRARPRLRHPALQDADGDGLTPLCGDCDDSDPAILPGATEICDGLDDDCDGSLPADELDADGDGEMSCEGDCDDSDPWRFAGSDELCDGVDNDCDGVAGSDEVDDDGDGFMVCEDDCDDADANISPDAEEVCDGLDNDCDGTADADEVDSDGDGLLVCEGDCDDTDPLILPGAPETCDGVDEDCDGLVDNGGAGTATAAAFGTTRSATTASTSDFRGNLYQADEDGVLVGAQVYVRGSSAGAVTFEIYEALPSEGIFRLMDSAVANLPTSADWVDVELSTPLVADSYYFVGVQCGTSTSIWYKSPAALSSGAGMTPMGADTESSHTPGSFTLSLSTSTLYAQRLTALHADADDLDADGDGQTPWCGDCDDADPTVYDGAPETCGDGVDQSCDGYDASCAY